MFTRRAVMFSKTKSILTHEKINQLVRSCFGQEVLIESISELTDGFFNAIYVLGFSKPVKGYEEMVLKVGVEENKHILTYEKDIIHTEILVYQMLSKTEVPVPEVIHYDFSRTLINCDYFFMVKLQGQTWAKQKSMLTPQNTEQLQHDLGRYTACIHSIKGNYFGYIKDDSSYHYSTWREAFRSFIDNIINDGKNDNVDLPYEAILSSFEPLWSLLDEVKEPSLVNYDMWDKNIMLREDNGTYVIDGFIDHERAFFGDPIAEFISTVTICGELQDALSFQKGYSEIRPFVFNKKEQIRFWMYSVYMGLLAGVEIYRYDQEDIPKFLEMSRYLIKQGLDNIRELE